MSDVKMNSQTVRREYTIESLVEATRDLMRAGVLRPTAKDVAATAYCSLRTVFQYFTGMDAIYKAALQDQSLKAEILNRIHPELLNLSDEAKEKVLQAILT